MNPILFDFGFIKIYWYSICILIGVLIGGFLIMKESKRFKISEDDMLNLILFAIVFGILGARIYYVIFNWSYYHVHLSEIIRVWEGGLAIHGGIIAGLIWVVYYTKKEKLDTFKILDILVVGLIIGQICGRWGNFFNGEAHGGPTTLLFLESLHLPKFIIDGMNLYGVYYHPTFLYESLWCLIGFIFMLVIRRRKFLKVGQLTGFYLIWYGFGRFFIEGLRTDSLMLGSLRVAQVVSIVMIVAGLIFIIYSLVSKKHKRFYNEVVK